MTRQRIATGLSFAVAVGITVAAMLGPLVLGIIRFRMTELLENQYVGGEIVSFLVVAPALVAAGVLWLRRDPLAPALAFGPALYTVYTFVTAILGQDFIRFPGNVEKAFPLYMLLVAAGFGLALMAGSELARHAAPVPSTGLRRAVGFVFLAIALFFTLAWSGQIFLVLREDPPAGYADSPTLFWLIRMLDLGFLLPAFAATGIGLLKRQQLAVRLSYGLVSFGVCMAGALLGMSMAMFLRDDPAASVGMTAFLLPVTACLAGIAIRTLMYYRRGGSGAALHGSMEVHHASQ